MQTIKRKADSRKLGKSRLAYLLLAGLLAASIAITGTLAYTGSSQTALNRFEGFVNHGVRLHDDYAFEPNKAENNKDIYVENYGDTPLVVRVRLDEFYQIGADEPVIGKDGASYNDPRWGWVTFTLPNPGNPATTITGKLVTAGDGDWQWELGGQKYYLPTENIYDGDPNPDNAYSSGKLLPFTPGVYTPASDVQQPDPGNYFFDSDGETKDGVRKYYTPASWGWTFSTMQTDLADPDIGWNIAGDTFAAGNPGLPLSDYIAAKGELKDTDIGEIWTNNVFPTFSGNAAHLPGGYNPLTDGADFKPFYAKTVQETLPSSVITIDQWNGTDTGPFWILDRDGWFYWAQLLPPGEATGLLLHAVNLIGAPKDDYFYGINAVMQACTINDVTKFGDGTTTDGVTWRDENLITNPTFNTCSDKARALIGLISAPAEP